MNETLKRAISGAIYVILLLASILYSTESFFILFGAFLLIAVYEFCNLVQINKVFPLLFATVFYSGINLVSFYKPLTEEIIYSVFNEKYTILLDIDLLYKVLLFITILVSLKCIYFLFYDNIQTLTSTSKYIYLLGYILLPFVFITKISFGVNRL